MSVGIITGTGLYELPLDDPSTAERATPWGPVSLRRGTLGGAEVVHVSRHGAGHDRLSNQTEPRATITALAEEGVSAIIATTVVGGVDPGLELGAFVVFDDLHFPSNRLPGGELCTLFSAAGQAGRGHWIFDVAYPGPVRAHVLAAAADAGRPAHDGGVYGHVDGPRLNSAPEIAALAAVGVTAVSQTGGPETVLAGEAEIPFCLVGYVTDHANGVMPAPTPPDELGRLLAASAPAFTELLTAAAPRVGADPGAAAGFVYRLG